MGHYWLPVLPLDAAPRRLLVRQPLRCRTLKPLRSAWRNTGCSRAFAPTFCFKSLSIAESTVTLAVGGYNTGFAPGVTVTTVGELSPSGVDELSRLLAQATVLPADTTFGCTGCTDSAVSSLRLRVGNSWTTLTWDADQAPTPLPELYEAFDGLISELAQCEPSNRVQRINACVTTNPGFKIVRRPDLDTILFS